MVVVTAHGIFFAGRDCYDIRRDHEYMERKKGDQCDGFFFCSQNERAALSDDRPCQSDTEYICDGK